MSRIKLTFDKNGNVETPTLVLCRQNCSRIGAIPNVQDFTFSDEFENVAEMSFTVYKSQCSSLWAAIKDFRNVYVPEWNTFFQLKVDLQESDSTTKSVTATRLANVELSKILNPALEIYTETDIDSKDGAVTTFYNPDNTELSALHRILAVAINYEIGHVDSTLWNLKPEISETSQCIYDTLIGVGEQFGIHYDFDVFIDKPTGKVRRVVSAYDLYTNCGVCGERGDDFTKKCPECGNTNLIAGYGKDTTIFISTENLADDITFTTNSDQVFNCFYLDNSDEDFIAAVKNCNPNGSQYLWYFAQQDKEDMSRKLYEKLYSETDGYYNLYDYYQNDKDYTTEVNPEYYNTLYTKYNEIAPDYLEEIKTPIIGYSALINAYYNAVDMASFLENTLMPSIDISYDTSAEKQEKNLRTYFTNNSVSVKADTQSEILKTQGNSEVLGMAETLIDSRYKVKVQEYLYDKGATSGKWKFVITNYSNDDDYYISEDFITININTDYENFMSQKIQKVLEKGENKNYGIAEIMKSENLAEELKSYGVIPLNTIRKCVEGVLSILTDMGVNETDTSKKDLCEKIKTPFLEKQGLIDAAIAEREAEVEKIEELYDTTINKTVINGVHNLLNMEQFLGEELWKELNIYRRESTYENSNYIASDTNAKTIGYAKDYIESATKELVKSATLQHSISASLKNLMSMKEFAPLRDSFAIGNWIRIQVDEEIYKLRLLSYSLDFQDSQSMNVEFSDVIQIGNDCSDIQSILETAKTMGSTYSFVEKQASDGSDSAQTTKNWIKNGLDVTLTQIANGSTNQTVVWDETGLLFKRLRDDNAGFEPEQMKIINSTLFMTKDNWGTLSTAVGKFAYQDADPQSETYGKYLLGYGINAEMLIGDVILGRELGIHTENNNFYMNTNGLMVTNGTYTFTVNPNESSIFTIKNKTEDIISFDQNGRAYFKGTITALDGKIGNLTLANGALYSGTDSMISTTAGIYLGTDGFRQYSDANTYVNIQNGKIVAYGAELHGNIYADSGMIGKIAIKDGGLISSSSDGKSFIELSAGSIYMESSGLWSRKTQMNINGIDIAGTYDDVERTLTINDQEILMKYNDTVLFSAVATKSASTGEVACEVNVANLITEENATFLKNINIFGDTEFYGTLTITEKEKGIVVLHTASNGGVDLGQKVTIPPAGEAGIRPIADNECSCGHTSYRWTNVYSVNGVDQKSDEREKNILDMNLVETTDLFMSLQPIAFKWKNSTDNKIHLGLGARDTERKINSFGYKSSDFNLVHSGEQYSMNYQEVQMLTMVQTQKNIAKINELENEITNLKQQINDMKSILKTYQ